MSISQILLFSLCLTAGQGNPSQSRWEADIQKFEQEDRAMPPPQGANLFVGSSSIRLWDLKSSFPEYTVINRGFGGSQISDSLEFADRIITPYHPKVIVFYSGDNDLASGKSPEMVCEDFKALAQHIRTSLPDAKLVLISIKPSTQRWHLAEAQKKANQLIQDHIKEDDHLVFIDVWHPLLGEDGNPRKELLAADGLHLSPEGYKIWNALVQPFLAK